MLRCDGIEELPVDFPRGCARNEKSRSVVNEGEKLHQLVQPNRVSFSGGSPDRDGG